MKPGLSQEELKIMAKIFRKFPAIQEVLLFGSRAMGTFKPGADVDLALKGKSITLKIVARVKALLDEETPLPYLFDVVDYSQVMNPEFKSHIDRHGKSIYRKE